MADAHQQAEKGEDAPNHSVMAAAMEPAASIRNSACHGDAHSSDQPNDSCQRQKYGTARKQPENARYHYGNAHRRIEQLARFGHELLAGSSD